MEKKRTYHHDNLKEKLILKALEFLDKKPYETITVRELTDSIGVSRTAIYRHFNSKEHLFQAVILKGFEQLQNALKPIYEDKSIDIKDKFYKIIKVYVDFALESPPRYRLMMGDKLMDVRQDGCELENEIPEGGFELIISLVSQAQEIGIFKKDNPVQQAIAIWSIMHGHASLLIDGHPIVKQMQNNTQKILFEMIIKGLG